MAVQIGRRIQFWSESGGPWIGTIHDIDEKVSLTHLIADIVDVKSNATPIFGSEKSLTLDAHTMTWSDQTEVSDCTFRWADDEELLTIAIISLTGESVAKVSVASSARVWDLARNLHTIDGRYFSFVSNGAILDFGLTLMEANVTDGMELTAVAAEPGVGRQVEYWSKRGDRWFAKVKDYDAARRMTHLLTDIQEARSSRAPWSGSEEWLQLDIEAMRWSDEYGHVDEEFKWLD